MMSCHRYSAGVFLMANLSPFVCGKSLIFSIISQTRICNLNTKHVHSLIFSLWIWKTCGFTRVQNTHRSNSEFIKLKPGHLVGFYVHKYQSKSVYIGLKTTNLDFEPFMHAATYKRLTLRWYPSKNVRIALWNPVHKYIMGMTNKLYLKLNSMKLSCYVVVGSHCLVHFYFHRIILHWSNTTYKFK